MIYRFEGFTINTGTRELLGPEAIKLEPQVFDLLNYLVENHGRVVTKDDLINAVWDGRIVSESTLSSRINAVRKAVNDNGVDQRVVRTIPRVGFRFVANVTQEQEATPNSADESTKPPATQNADSDVKSERRPLTLLLCDVLTSLPREKNEDPESLQKFLEQCQDKIEDCVHRFGGVIAPSPANMFQVHFGYPEAREDDSERAVRAALAIREQFQRSQNSGPVQHARPKIAVGTGLVVVNPNAKTIHSIIGEPILVADEIMSQSHPGDVLICDETRRQIGSLFACKEISLQDRTEDDHRRCYEIIDGKVSHSRFEALRVPDNQFVGRQDEIEMLMRRWQLASKGEGQVALITGEAGIGKSRICKALKHQIPEDAAHRINYHCSALYQDSPFYPISNQLIRDSAIEQSDDDQTREAKLKKFLSPHNGMEANDLDLFLSLTALDGTSTPTSPGRSTQNYKEQVLNALTTQIKQASAKRPLLVTLEDAHWCDATSLEFLALLVEAVHQLPILLLITARPEFHAPWPKDSHHLDLNLNRLSRDHCKLVLQGIITEQTLAAPLEDEILNRSGGIPLFVEEIAKAVLVKKSLLDQPDNIISVPTTLHGSLMTRMDQHPAGKAVAKIGAALGASFSYEILEQVGDLSSEEIGQGLSDLVNAELLFQRGTPPEATYQFKHMLVRDVAYEAILKRDRPTIHQRIFDALTKDGRTRPEVLAKHASLAQIHDQATYFWRMAAQLASSRGAYYEAGTHLEAAIQSAQTDDGSQDEVLELLGWAAFNWISAEGYMSKRAKHATTRGVALAQRLPFSKYRYTPFYANWALNLATGPQLAVLAQIEDVLVDIERSKSRIHLFFGNAFVGYSALTVGQIRKAETCLSVAREIFDSNEHNRGSKKFGHIAGPDLYFRLALLRAVQGRLEESKTNIDLAVEACPQDLGIHAEAQLSMKLAMVSGINRDMARLEQFASRLDAIANQFNLPVAILCADLYNAMLDVARGNTNGAERFYAATDRYQKNTMTFESATHCVIQADLLTRHEMYEDAAKTIEKAKALIEQTEEYLSKAEALRISGVLAAHYGDIKKAQDYFAQALKIAERQGTELWRQRIMESTQDLKLNPKSLSPQSQG